MDWAEATVLSRTSWARELYEILSFAVIGLCVWIAGEQLGFFNWGHRFAIEHGFLNLLMLSSCMCVGFLAASVRKSFLLRNSLRARIEAEACAESMARHDALTGLANRRMFHESVDKILKLRTLHECYAVLLIDLDRFKPVNDIHGHAAGNAVLCTIAERLLEVVPQKSTVARIGGDEFAVFAPYHSRDDLIGLVERILDSLRNPIPWNQGQVEVGATIGIAVTSEEDQEPDALLHSADVAMYEGKREVRGSYRFFHIDMDVALKVRARLETDLKRAIADGQIEPFFQPIVSLPSKEPIGFEVLARWNHPTDGLLLPDTFIPIAEEAGMIADLFYGILRQACLAARNWPAHLVLAVNISPRQVQDHKLTDRIINILSETGFAPSRLEVEITETALISDIEAARSVITSLQSVGIGVALDDFGDGYSSLYHLRELRFNKIKIDKSYIASLAEGSERSKLVDAIIQLGSSLSLQTSAEGIETSTSLDWLSEQGCNFGQGYLFGRAMSKSAADCFLTEQSTPIDTSPACIGEEAGAAPEADRMRMLRSLKNSRDAPAETLAT